MGNQTAKTAFPIPQSSEKYWEIKNQTDTSAELYLYSTISSRGEEWGDTSAKDVINAVKNLGNISQLKIYINSPGGTVSEGMAIKAFLARQTFKKDVYIDGLCASIATAIAFGINATVHMESTALVMIHNAWTGVYGNAAELRKCILLMVMKYGRLHVSGPLTVLKISGNLNFKVVLLCGIICLNYEKKRINRRLK